VTPPPRNTPSQRGLGLVLQTLLIFLGFNVAWLLLLDDRKPAPACPPVKAE
jgi:hypothetical protein